MLWPPQACHIRQRLVRGCAQQAPALKRLPRTKRPAQAPQTISVPRSPAPDGNAGIIAPQNLVLRHAGKGFFLSLLPPPDRVRALQPLSPTPSLRGGGRDKFRRNPAGYPGRICRRDFRARDRMPAPAPQPVWKDRRSHRKKLKTWRSRPGMRLPPMPLRIILSPSIWPDDWAVPALLRDAVHTFLLLSPKFELLRRNSGRGGVHR